MIKHSLQSNETLSKEEFTALSELINNSRIAQSWATLSPDELKPLVVVWSRQFKLARVEPFLYESLFDRAVVYRTDEIKQGKKPTPFSIELFLAMIPPVYIHPATGRPLK